MRTLLALARLVTAIGLIASFLFSVSQPGARAEEDKGSEIAEYFLITGVEPSQGLEHHYPAEELVARQSKSGRWGYVRWDDVREGRVDLVVTKEDPVWYILPKFNSAGCFSEGAAPVEVDGKWGFIDENGNFLVPPALSSPPQFVGGTATVDFDDQCAIIGRSGQLLTKPQGVTFLSHVTEGVVAAEKDGKWGYIDLSGEFVIAPQFDDANDFSEGIAAVARGKLVIDDAKMADGGLSVDGDQKWRYIMKNGSNLTDQEFDYAGQFHCGRAVVCLDEKWGVLDCFGKLVVPLEYEGMGSYYCEGLVRAKRNGKWGYLDLCGNPVIEPAFDDAGDFEDGLACVLYGDQLCVIDPLGNFKQRFPRQDKAKSAPSIAARIPERIQTEGASQDTANTP